MLVFCLVCLFFVHLFVFVWFCFVHFQGYEAVAQKFASIRMVRGDNYCALRATLFQALSQATQLPSWLQSEDFTVVCIKI